MEIIVFTMCMKYCSKALPFECRNIKYIFKIYIKNRHYFIVIVSGKFSQFVTNENVEKLYIYEN